MEYEIFVRINNGDGEIKTSNLTYKFRVIADSATHIKNQNTTPYTDRLRDLKR
jgi:hypothetical protein